MSDAYESGRRAFYSPIGSFAAPHPQTPYGRQWLRGFRAEAANPTGIPGTRSGPDHFYPPKDKK